MQLSWRPDQGELGRRADLPGDGFAYVATMFPSAEANFEWFEVTEVFTTVSPQQINAAMSARNGIASKQPVDFDDFLGMLRKGRPSRVEQRKAADAVIAQTERKLRKSSYRELMERYGYGTLVVGLPLWFAVLPEDPWRAENALDDFLTRTSLGLNELKQRALERGDCPFRQIRVTWDTTPEAWREWSRKRSADYDDAANMGLENLIPVAKMMALFSELDRAISETECPDSEAPSMSLFIEQKTQKTRRGRGPYPKMVVSTRTVRSRRSRTRTAGRRHTQKGKAADLPGPLAAALCCENLWSGRTGKVDRPTNVSVAYLEGARDTAQGANPVCGKPSKGRSRFEQSRRNKCLSHTGAVSRVRATVKWKYINLTGGYRLARHRPTGNAKRLA